MTSPTLETIQLPISLDLSVLAAGWPHDDRMMAPVLERLEELAPILNTLRLNLLRLDPKRVELLTPRLQCLTSLTKLQLIHTDLGAGGMEILAPSFLHLVNLRSLDLTGNRLRSEGLNALIPVLPSLLLLEELFLDSNQLDDEEGMKALSSLLPLLPSCSLLSLSANGLSAQEMKALVPTLQDMKGLTELNLACNRLADEGVKALLPALAILSSLRALDLYDNQITLDGLQALESTFPNLSELRSLDLGSNRCEYGLPTLVSILQNLTALTALSLRGRGNVLESSAIPSLTPYVQQNTSLVHLGFHSSELPPETESALQIWDDHFTKNASRIKNSQISLRGLCLDTVRKRMLNKLDIITDWGRLIGTTNRFVTAKPNQSGSIPPKTQEQKCSVS